MLITLKPGSDTQEINELRQNLELRGLKVYEIKKENQIAFGIIGDISKINREEIENSTLVENITKVQQPYKLANRIFHPEDTVIKIGNETIGGKKLAIIAGPCSVESEEQIIAIAKDVKASGAGFLRGGAFKPRTSPYSFQGLREEGLNLLKSAKQETGLPIVTEIMSADMIEEFALNVDIIQVGARNMQNFELLKELGKTDKPILLKRGLSATIEELIMSAEYIMSAGNEKVILCERGIRTFETYTRNTLDLSAIPAIKKLSHLPVIVDPSHACGVWWMVEPLSMAAAAVGADGLIIEVHNDPENAKCDGQQSLKPKKFKMLMDKLGTMTGLEKMVI